MASGLAGGTWRSARAPIPSRRALITPRRPFSSSAAYISRTGSKTRSAASCACSREGRSTASKVSGSPYWIVTFGNWSLLHPRTPLEPWIATGTTGTPDSSAR